MEYERVIDPGLAPSKRGRFEQPSYCWIVFSVVLSLVSAAALTLLVLMELRLVNIQLAQDLVPGNCTLLDHSAELQEIKDKLDMVLNRLNQQLPKADSQPPHLLLQTSQPWRNRKMEGNPNLLELLKNDTDLSTFLKKIQDAGMDKVINHEGDFTIFAPTNEAYNNLPSYYKDFAETDVTKMHLTKGDFSYDNMTSDHWEDKLLRTQLSKRDVRINRYDLKQGKIVTANGQKIVEHDKIAFNGRLHKISGVMASVYERHHGNIFTELDKHGKIFGIFLRLANNTEFEKTLQLTHNLTLFAPTDDSFKKLPESTQKRLETDAAYAQQVLKSHLVEGRTWFTAGMFEGLQLKSISGAVLTISGSGASLKINSKTAVVEADRYANNGAWHTIDAVLMP